MIFKNLSIIIASSLFMITDYQIWVNFMIFLLVFKSHVYLFIYLLWTTFNFILQFIEMNFL